MSTYVSPPCPMVVSMENLKLQKDWSDLFGYDKWQKCKLKSVFLSFLPSFCLILQATVLIIESLGVGLMNTMKEGKNRISRGDQVSRRTTLSWLGIRVWEKMSEYGGLCQVRYRWMTGMKDPGLGELFRKAYSNREFKRVVTRFLLLCVLVSLKVRAYLRFSDERD